MNIILKIQSQRNKLHYLLSNNALDPYLDKIDKETIEETKDFLEEMVEEYKEIMKKIFLLGFEYCADYTTTRSDRNFLYEMVDIDAKFKTLSKEL